MFRCVVVYALVAWQCGFLGFSVLTNAASECVGAEKGYPQWILVDLGMVAKSWNDAQAYCQQHFDTDLVAITSFEAETALLDLKHHKCGCDNSEKTAIGGKLSAGNYQLFWTDGTQDTGYRHWSAAQPYYGRSTKCVHLDSVGKWRNDDCDKGVVRFALCNSPIVPPMESSPEFKEKTKDATSNTATTELTDISDSRNAVRRLIDPWADFTLTGDKLPFDLTKRDTSFFKIDGISNEKDAFATSKPPILATTNKPLNSLTKAETDDSGSGKKKKVLSSADFWIGCGSGSVTLVLACVGICCYKLQRLLKGNSQMTDVIDDSAAVGKVTANTKSQNETVDQSQSGEMLKVEYSDTAPFDHIVYVESTSQSDDIMN